MSEDEPSLEEFAKREKLKDCVVCQLPDKVRAQVEEAVDKEIPRRVRLAWLEEIGHGEITNKNLTTHFSGHHPRVRS